MEVGAEDVSRADSLSAVPTVVAGAFDHPAQWLDVRSQIRSAAVILEAHQGWGLEPEARHIYKDVADVAASAGLGVQVHQPQPRQALALGCHVVGP